MKIEILKKEVVDTEGNVVTKSESLTECGEKCIYKTPYEWKAAELLPILFYRKIPFEFDYECLRCETCSGAGKKTVDSMYSESCIKCFGNGVIFYRMESEISVKVEKKDDLFDSISQVVERAEIVDIHQACEWLKSKFSNVSESASSPFAHCTIGMWLRNRLLWSETSLSKWFSDNGVFHPDDMSSLILSTLESSVEDRLIAVKRVTERNVAERNKSEEKKQ